MGEMAEPDQVRVDFQQELQETQPTSGQINSESGRISGSSCEFPPWLGQISSVLGRISGGSGDLVKFPLKLDRPAPRVHQTLINITKKFLHEPNPNPQSESFSARPPAARATRHAHDTPLEPTAAGYSSCDFSGARLGPHASLRRSAKFFGACGGQLDQILTN